MDFIKKVKAVFGDTYAKGDLFEQYVYRRFFKENFTVVCSTPSKDDLDGMGSEACRNPDYQFRCKQTKEPFWVECKYRSDTFEDGTIQWCEKWQLKRYKEIREETGIRTYIIIGLGGSASNPERIFCLDLDTTKYNKLFRSSYEPYEIEVSTFKSLEHLNKQLP